jgi:protein-S-isoprenylcysteine O-methyltransferase Ste14
MELKIPPLVLLVITGLLMWGVSALSLVSPIESMLLGPMALIVFLIGLGIGLWAAMTFKKANTTVDPRVPEASAKLVCTGIFNLSRNPMYLSMLLELAGLALWLGNPLNVVLLVFFVWYINKFQIAPEERALKAKFADEVQSYHAKVRRWI